MYSRLPYTYFKPSLRKSKSHKPKESSEATSQKGKEKFPEGPKKHKEPKEAPKTMKKLLADAQGIGAKQEAKAKKVAEKKVAEKEAARSDPVLKETARSESVLERRLG